MNWAWFGKLWVGSFVVACVISFVAWVAGAFDERDVAAEGVPIAGSGLTGGGSIDRGMYFTNDQGEDFRVIDRREVKCFENAPVDTLYYVDLSSVSAGYFDVDGRRVHLPPGRCFIRVIEVLQ